VTTDNIRSSNQSAELIGVSRCDHTGALSRYRLPLQITLLFGPKDQRALIGELVVASAIRTATTWLLLASASIRERTFGRVFICYVQSNSVSATANLRSEPGSIQPRAATRKSAGDLRAKPNQGS